MEVIWISVKDRLPEISGLRVLICIQNCEVREAVVRKEEFYLPVSDTNFKFREVTHWALLPDPPKD